MDSDRMDYVMHNSEPPSTPQAHHPRQGCPAWRPDHGAYLPSPHGMISPTRNPHSPYDPVHGSSAPWFPQHPFQWSPPTGPAAQPRAAHSDPYFNSMSSGLGGPAGPIQPGYLPIPPYPPPLDPFGPLHFPHRTSHQRPTAPTHPSHSGQSGQSAQPSFSPERHNQVPPFRSVGLPAANFSLPQLQPQPQPQTHSPSTGDSSSSSSTPERRPTFTTAPDSPRGPNRTSGSFTTSPPSLRSLSSHRHESAPHPLRSLSQYAEPSVASSDPTPPISSSTERARRAPPTRHREIRMSHVYPPNSDGDSEDDLDQLHEREARFIEQYSSGAAPYPVRIAEGGERQLRAHQLLRGQMSSKRVASKSAISSLQSVEIDTLPESERTCVICYNEFGVPNPEGINEAPLRLPKCKHVFGDHCIKKWFEESDSCPYCRDKVPSEPQVRATPEAIRSFFRQAQRMSTEHGSSAGQRGENDWMRPGSAEFFASLANPRNVVLGIDIGSTTRTIERRSPPDDPSESRRRTRARHGSLRGSPSSIAASGNGSTNGGVSSNGNGNGASNSGSRPNSFGGSSSTPHQQSPIRERFMPPYLQSLWQQNSHQNGPVRRTLTPHVPRQFTGAYGQHHRPHHGQHSPAASHPRHPSAASSTMPPFAPMPFEASPHAPAFLPPTSTLGGENQPFSNSVNNGSAQQAQGDPGQAFSTALPPFSQQLPPVGGDGSSGPSFHGLSGSHGSQASY